MALVFLLVAQSALATWSVVAINMETGEVVIASATCVAQARFPRFPAKDLRDIQAIVVPGKAAAVAQASVDSSRLNRFEYGLLFPAGVTRSKITREFTDTLKKSVADLGDGSISSNYCGPE